MDETRSGAGQTGAVILFDGVCNFCNGAVNFIIDRDPSARFRFAALQSTQASAVLAPLGRVPEADPNTFILVEDGRLYERSTAALRVARRMHGAWKLFYAFIIVPRPIRDAAYSLFARNRYRLFGKADACRMPTPELRARFL
ncbi:MAG TPA: thiol-disulfide oxidoreductase DCC family protein [Myxococcus sp.]|nr:thiol-disulfide oxidoreductase DCC family protein [Myxococcus sp.]